MSGNKPRICIIGAGQSGMCTLYQIKLRGDDAPDVECYEKQDTWNGQWNYTWRTGTDEYGELINGSMYRHLWTVGPKETQEMSDYTFKDHFGKLLPSYVLRDTMRQYLHGRWTRGKCGDMTPYVHFRHVVSKVDYRPETDDFQVCVTDLLTKSNKTELFTHVVVANGKFTVPDIPKFQGIETFPGRVVHSHDLKHVDEFKGMSVLIVGSLISASDIAVQLLKFKVTTQIICSHKKEPMGIHFPTAIQEKPQIKKVDQKTVWFEDGSSASVDAIILGTGYIYHHPFLQGKLGFDYHTHTHMCPNYLYKGTLRTKEGNNKLFFVGAFYEILNPPAFVIQGEWVIRYIMGEIASEPVSANIMQANVDKWQKQFHDIKSIWDILTLRRDAVLEMAEDVDYPVEYIHKAVEILKEMMRGRLGDIATYRDKCFNSMYTGELAPKPRIKWMDNFDDSSDTFVQLY